MPVRARAFLSGRALEAARAVRRAEGGGPPDVAVVIDVLRATTTLIHAFARGAAAARALPDAEAARLAAKELPPGTTLLCGERGGLCIPGFDLGNSPREYVNEFVFGRTLLLVTTNGTRALLRTRDARRQALAGFVNLTAIARRLRVLAVEPDTFEAWIVAAGKEDEPGDEDSACALALLDALATGAPRFEVSIEPGDEAAVERVRGLRFDDDAALAAWLAATEHGRALVALDPAFGRDLADAAKRDAFDLVPEGRGGVIDQLVRKP